MRGLVASRPAIQEMLKKILQKEGKWYRPESQIYMQKGSVREGINQGKIKSFIFLFFIDIK